VVNTLPGILAVIAGYLIGGFPSAYIVTKIATGKDIRTIGTGHTGRGNVGTRNVFVNIGKIPGIVVAILDILKGIVAVLLAAWILGWPQLSHHQIESGIFFALGAGLAAVIGHIWPVYLKFRGGGGLAIAVGVLAIQMTRELACALVLTIILVFITRNVILSLSLALLSLPLWALYFQLPWWLVIYPLVILLVMFVHFVPNIKAEIKKAGTPANLITSLLRRGRTKTG
jgi:acyl phosphate:glycerol-3-phosphate acyltransferase